jgi:hypothetical protein
VEVQRGDVIYFELLQGWIFQALLWGIDHAGAVVGALGVLGAWVWSRRFSRAFQKVTHIHAASLYSELDRIYLDLLKLALELPHLRTPQPIANRDEIALQFDYDPYPGDPIDTQEQRSAKARKISQYDAYAFMVWNFIETIHDRCQDYPELLGTWATVVAAENRLHRGWFLKQMLDEHEYGQQPGSEPSAKFCKEFQVFIHDKNFLPVDGAEGKRRYRYWSYNGRSDFKVKPKFREIDKSRKVTNVPAPELV